MRPTARRCFPAGCLLALAATWLLGCAEPEPQDGPRVAAASGPAKPGPKDPDAPQEFTEVDGGLKYRILRKGHGEKPGPTDRVTVHYWGKLDNGKAFDSSYVRGKPATFRLNQVIPGWTQGLQYVREGGMIELEIPPELGYGPDGSPPAIPPNATLHFLVELIEIE